MAGSKDGIGSSDHDQPYQFGWVKPHVDWPYPFTERQFARLLVLRGRVRDERTPLPTTTTWRSPTERGLRLI